MSLSRFLGTGAVIALRIGRTLPLNTELVGRSKLCWFVRIALLQLLASAFSLLRCFVRFKKTENDSSLPTRKTSKQSWTVTPWLLLLLKAGGYSFATLRWWKSTAAGTERQPLAVGRRFVKSRMATQWTRICRKVGSHSFSLQSG